MNRIIVPPPLVAPKPNTPIYDQIRVWGRKTWNVVQEYIKHYTSEGEVVLDPFAGSGVTVIEALRIGRRAIYNDLNKYLTFVAKSSIYPVKPDEVRRLFQLVESELEKNRFKVLVNNTERWIDFKTLYKTKCPICGEQATILSTDFSLQFRVNSRFINNLPIQRLVHGRKLERIAANLINMLTSNFLEGDSITYEKIHKHISPKDVGASRSEEVIKALEVLTTYGFLERVGETPTNIHYMCRNCGKRNKTPDKLDIEFLVEIEKMRSPYYYPTNRLEYRISQNKSEPFLTYRPGCESVDKLFTKRNLLALSFLNYLIESMQIDEAKKDILKLAFASITYECSKMKRKGAGSWGEKNYVIRPFFTELNVFEKFLNRSKRIIEARKELSCFKHEVMMGDVSEVLSGKATVCFLSEDARRLPLPNESIDYIFTDPEYGPSIQYYELSLMASSWLRIENDWKREIVVNEKQGKDLEKYRDMLAEAFIECYRVLKKGRYMTVTFHSREIKYWNALYYAIAIAGFEYVDSIYQPPPKEYTDWLYARNPGKMRGDIYVTFMKPNGGS